MPGYWGNSYPRDISRLGVERYERVQFEWVSIATYVQSIGDAALVLHISENEAQVVERIVEGLTRNQRARFVFQAPSSSLLQLEKLAGLDRIAYADQTRTIQPTAVTVGVGESHSKLWNSRRVHAQSLPTARPGEPVVCFYCQKPRHIQKRCFLRLAQLRKQEQPAATS